MSRTPILALSSSRPFIASLVVLISIPAVARAQQGCPRASGADAQAGWSAYRSGDMATARSRFQAALARCPDDQYARTGLGYVELRASHDTEARALFETVLAAQPDDVDALVGLGLLAWRAGDLRGVSDRFQRVLQLAPDNATAKEYLAKLPPGLGGSSERPPASVHPPVGPQQVDSADAAWRKGDQDLALLLYLRRLQKDSTDEVALHRVALMRAWAGHYQLALSLLDRVIKEDPANLDAQVDHARVRAWSGDTSGALDELAKLLKAHPNHAGALQARATFEAWAGRYNEALSTYDKVLAISPDNASARRQEAQVLSWASRFAESRALYDSLLAKDPADVDARLGLAQVLTYANDLKGALGEYHRVLAGHPDNPKALQGLGRALSWEGRLVAGEAAYREAVAADSSDVEGFVGLAQNLRWQGRDAAALEVLERARRVAPDNGDVRAQLHWVNVTLGRQVRPGVVVENDSDHNHMVTTTATAAWHPLPRLGLRADAYQRGMSQNVLDRSAYGLTVSGSWQLEPGWTFSAGAGGSRSNGTGKASFTAWNLGASTPGRYPEGASLTVSSAALDATAALVEHGVVVTQVTLNGRWTRWPGWRVDAALGRALFNGSARNLRGNGALSVSRRLKRVWTVGVGGRAFGFQKRLRDGYFDPDFYGIAEVTGRWLYSPDPWSFLVEVAPGVQKVGSAGSAAGALRASTRVAYRVGPGREVSVGFGYSTTGLQTFSTGASSYRYTALIFGATWVF